MVRMMVVVTVMIVVIIPMVATVRKRGLRIRDRGSRAQLGADTASERERWMQRIRWIGSGGNRERKL